MIVRSWLYSVIATAIAGLFGFVDSAIAQSSRDRFVDRVQPLLQKYCVECHSESSSEAGIALDQFANQGDAIRAEAVWLKTLDALESHLMPPADARQPTIEETQVIVDWIEQDFVSAQCDKSSNRPPAVVMRRLNRDEYDNTIRDLLGVTLNLAKDFPQDEIGFGFDNIGSALNLSPIHIEKLFAAAERAIDAAVIVPNVEGKSPKELIGLQTYPLSANDPVKFAHTLKPGRYLAEFSLVRVGIPESIAPPLLEIGFGTDKRTVRAVRVQDETVIYRYWLTVFDGDAQVSVAVSPSSRKDENFSRPLQVAANVSGDQRYGNNVGLHVDSMVVRGPVGDTVLERLEANRQILNLPPAPADESRMESAQAILTKFAGRAFRRPASPLEVKRLIALYQLAAERGESFERAIQVALTSVLVSPQFLFLVEPDSNRENRRLTEYELASRLSYFLWSSMPDAELFGLAEREELRENLPGQVARMLGDAKSASFITNFCGQWLQLRKLAESTPDQEMFPTFDIELREAMREESERYFEHVLRKNRSVLELLDSNYTFVNEKLARHYGLAGVTGREFQRVEVANDQRGGVLTHASVLTITSNPNRTSPVKRGKWLLQQVLGTPPPPPPPIVEKLNESPDAVEGASLRDRLMRHREHSVCASCHNQMDPIGFALENYDAIGRWRTKEEQFPIDPSGELAGGVKFESAREFKQKLSVSGKKRFFRCLVENMLTYALGRGLESQDFCTVESIRKRLEADDGRIQSIILGIVESNAFQFRGEIAANSELESANDQK